MSTLAPSKRGTDEQGEDLAERPLIEQKQSAKQGELPEPYQSPEREQSRDQVQQSEQQQHLPEQVQSVKPGPPKRLIITIAILVCLIGAITSYQSVFEFLNTETTEDAYVTGHVHQVSCRVAGTIESVLVKDNQRVDKGQVLARIDPRDVQVEMAKAEAHLAKVQRDAIAAKHVVVYAARNFSAVSKNADGSIAQAENAITKAEAGIRAAEEDVAVAKQILIEREAELHKAKLDLDRYTALANEGAIPLERLDTARKDDDVAVASRAAAVETIEQANSKLNQAYADLKISESQLVNAKSQALQADAADAQISVNAEQQASSDRRQSFLPLGVRENCRLTVAEFQ